jgi:hypothetical protein
MRTSFVIAAIAAFASACPSFNDEAYLAKPATEKLEQIWTAVEQEDTPLPYFDSQDSAALFSESMALTLSTIGDEMPESHTKFIHTEGAVAKVKLVNIGSHPFTGVFQGADHGIMRLSMAAEPDTSSISTVPSFGLKFLRDGIDSANVVAEYSVTGQDSWNFFENDFSNHISSTGPPSPGVVAIANLFATGTPWISTIGVLNMV